MRLPQTSLIFFLFPQREAVLAPKICDNQSIFPSRWLPRPISHRYPSTCQPASFTTAEIILTCISSDPYIFHLQVFGKQHTPFSTFSQWSFQYGSILLHRARIALHFTPRQILTGSVEQPSIDTQLFRSSSVATAPASETLPHRRPPRLLHGERKFLMPSESNSLAKSSKSKSNAQDAMPHTPKL